MNILDPATQEKYPFLPKITTDEHARNIIFEADRIESDRDRRAKEKNEVLLKSFDAFNFMYNLYEKRNSDSHKSLSMTDFFNQMIEEYQTMPNASRLYNLHRTATKLDELAKETFGYFIINNLQNFFQLFTRYKKGKKDEIVNKIIDFMRNGIKENFIPVMGPNSLGMRIIIAHRNEKIANNIYIRSYDSPYKEQEKEKLE